MTQDTQTPQQPQWEGHNVEVTADACPECDYSNNGDVEHHGYLRGLNEQQQRIQQADEDLVQERTAWAESMNVLNKRLTEIIAQRDSALTDRDAWRDANTKAMLELEAKLREAE